MILVTGGTGFLGSYFLRQLINKNGKVKALYRPNSSFALVNDIKNKVNWVQVDVLDIAALDNAFKDVTEVYHTAAMVSFQKKHHELMMQINVDGTTNVVNMALENKIEKLAHISSVAVFGRGKETNFITENTDWEDSKYNSQYAISKMLAEREVFRAHAEGLNTVVVNPSIILGSGNWYNGSAAFFKTVYNGLPFYTTGINGFVGADDVVNCTMQLMDKNIFGERFILNENNYSYEHIFNTIAHQLNVKPPTIKVTKLLSQLAWRAEGIKTLVTGKPSIVTKETAATSLLQCFYSNSKIIDAINYKFTPINKIIENTAKDFLATYKN